MTDPTHTITISIDGRNSHIGRQVASVSMGGDGGIDHVIEAFRAALVVMGFPAAMAARLDVREAE